MKQSQKYTYDELRSKISTTLCNEEMPKNLYTSLDGISRVVDAILRTGGEGWAAEVVDENGEQLLTGEEQQQFTNALQPHISSLLQLSQQVQEGGNTEESTKGVNEIYEKIMTGFQKLNGIFRNFAAQYGVLGLELSRDTQGDIPLFPTPVAGLIADGVAALSEGVILPPVTTEVLSKFKIPFRTIVFFCYLIMDVVRLTFGIMNYNTTRKVMSIMLSLLDLLKGDWKKAILTFVGYFGMMPMIYGEIGKVIVALFELMAPQIQESFQYGTLSAPKSILIGLLLSTFQMSAPEIVRIPVIDALKKISILKSQKDSILEEAGLPPLPDYLAPSFEDINNIQALWHDPAFVCSTEFQEALGKIKQVAILRVVLELMGIPLTEEDIKVSCKDGIKPYIQQEVLEAERQQIEEKPVEQTPIEQTPKQKEKQEGGRKLRRS